MFYCVFISQSWQWSFLVPIRNNGQASRIRGDEGLDGNSTLLRFGVFGKKIAETLNDAVKLGVGG